MRAFLTAAFLLMGGAIATAQSFGPIEGSNNTKAKLASAPGDYDAVADVPKGENVTIDVCFKGDAWCAAKWSDKDGFIDGSKVEVSVHGAQKTLAEAYRAHSKKLAAQDAKRKPAPIPQATASAAEIFAWGDSLTAGAGVPDKSASYPSLVAGQLRMPVRNLGIGGQTSTQIAARQGGLKTLFGVEGNAIPASGSVRIIERNIKPITGQETQEFTGKLAGVPGRLTRSKEGAYTFTRNTSGSATPCNPCEFVFDLAEQAKGKPVFIWAGRNGADPGRSITDDIAAMVAAAGTENYLVGSILTAESDGPQQVENIRQTNAALKRTYGNRYVDILGALLSQEVTTPAEVTQVSAGIVPRGFRFDNVHLNAAGYYIVSTVWSGAYNMKAKNN